MYQNIDPQRAYDLLQGEEDYSYVDVRTVAEFEAGHPTGAVNIPAFVREPSGQMAPNPAFVSEMKANFPEASRVLVGCQAGGRSARACDLLIEAGFSDIANVDGGFGGRPGIAGWAARGLPVSPGPAPGSYANQKKPQP